MWILNAFIVIVGITFSSFTLASKIEVDVNGLTCAFCVNSLQRQLQQLPDVQQVDISLKLKKVRIITRSKNPDLKKIEETVIHSGFTPVKIRTLDDEHE